jgi:hypothetical protein
VAAVVADSANDRRRIGVTPPSDFKLHIEAAGGDHLAFGFNTQ